MEELRELLRLALNAKLDRIILSNTTNAEQGAKVKIRPVLLKESLVFQETLYKHTQVFHSNYDTERMLERLLFLLGGLFRQGEIKMPDGEATILVSKKGKVTIRRKGCLMKGGTQSQSATEAPDEAGRLLHNRVKQYILQDGAPVDFLVGLGVQSPDGHVNKNRYDKFRQINRFLEFIEDVLDALPTDRTIRIIDFGCGKSYLTFAMYYYLHIKQGRDIFVTGLDLKEDVIRHCNELAQKLHYDNLSFERGDISTYEGACSVDMVVSLHACDTATDYALEKAVRWGAKVILAVPCCQHELNRQMHCDALKPVFRYGVIKERMAALITDALRANLLEQCGYETQILEFIDMEHTPKNLLIRGVKKDNVSNGMRRRGDIGSVTKLLQVTPALERLLSEQADVDK